GLVELLYDPAAALGHLRAGLEGEADPQARVRAAIGLAKAYLLNGRTTDAAAVLEAELVCTCLPADHPMVGRLRAELLFVSLGDATVLDKTYPRYGIPDPGGDDDSGARTVLAARALHSALSGQPSGPVLQDVSAALNQPPSPGLDSGLCLLIGGLVLLWGDELEAARRFCAEAQFWPVCRGSPLCRSLAAWMRGLVELRGGHLDRASELVATARRLGGPERWQHWSFAPLIAAADLAVDRGTAADLLAETASWAAGDPGPLLLGHIWLARRGHLRVAGGDVRRGLDDLEEAGRRLVGIGCLNPAVAPWRSDAAMALHRLGQGEDGYPLVEEEVRLAGRWGSPRPLAIALRRRALLRPGKALDDLTESLRLLHLAGMPMERARTMLALGRTHRMRRSPAKARTVLSEARSLALGGGAPGLLRRIEDELLMAGGRPRLRGGANGGNPLTAGEDRVARLAAAGRTNEQIAGELFVARRTVEIHLTSIYRKLRIRGRVELPEALKSLPSSGPSSG
ncbi:helix-turn-helix transcriptional regulator, partial [Actinophytocola sp.]|uniref:helix-turn-helix transcriptional regulator n=1 Tax=Actinophytocola sp. TaxID=1872138 RepID=UPI002D80A852